MRRFLLPAVVLSALLLCGGSAQAFHRHQVYGPPVAPAAGAPAPISPGQIIQLVYQGYQLLQDVRDYRNGQNNSNADNRAPARPQPVDSDTAARIQKIDASMQGLVDATNGVAKLNPGLYPDLIKNPVVNATKASAGASEGDGRISHGDTGPNGGN